MKIIIRIFIVIVVIGAIYCLYGKLWRIGQHPPADTTKAADSLDGEVKIRSAAEGKPSQSINSGDVPAPNFGASGLAQGSRGLAQTAYTEARTYVATGDLQIAAGKFEDIMDMDDSDSEFPDIRGQSGLELALVELKLGNKAKAIKAFQRTLTIKNCPDSITQPARKFLSKLEGTE